MARAPGLSIRLKLALSYAAFLMLAGLLLIAGVWVFLLGALPDVTASPIGVLDFRAIFLGNYLPAAAGTLGFLLIESRKIDRMGEFADWFTRQQELSLQARLRMIEGIEKVSGHNDYAPKLCPGFKVRSSDWLPASAFPRRGDNFVTA